MKNKMKINDLFEIVYIKNQSNIKYKKELLNAFSRTTIDNSFITFASLTNQSYIIYTTKSNSINCFDFNKEKIMKSINNAHNSEILSFRYNCNKYKNKEYIVSVSIDKNIKLWEFPTFSLIVNIERAHRNSFIFSLCILPLKNNDFILSTSGSDLEKIRVWDFKGNKIMEINDSNERTGFIDIYQSLDNNASYIIIGNYGNIKSFIFESNELYKVYCDNSEEKNDHTNFIIYDKDKYNIILIDSCLDGYIRLWDFHNTNLFKKIKCLNKPDVFLRNICLSENKKYLFVVCDTENSIKIIDLQIYCVITCIKVNTKELLSIKNIKHNIYGNCFLSKGVLNDNIKLWTTY